MGDAPHASGLGHKLAGVANEIPLLAPSLYSPNRRGPASCLGTPCGPPGRSTRLALTAGPQRVGPTCSRGPTGCRCFEQHANGTRSGQDRPAPEWALACQSPCPVRLHPGPTAAGEPVRPLDVLAHHWSTTRPAARHARRWQPPCQGNNTEQGTSALGTPINWGVWLGRHTCYTTTPVP